jgi:hypothetical protein
VSYPHLLSLERRPVWNHLKISSEAVLPKHSPPKQYVSFSFIILSWCGIVSVGGKQTSLFAETRSVCLHRLPQLVSKEGQPQAIARP